MQFFGRRGRETDATETFLHLHHCGVFKLAAQSAAHPGSSKSALDFVWVRIWRRCAGAACIRMPGCFGGGGGGGGAAPVLGGVLGVTHFLNGREG